MTEEERQRLAAQAPAGFPAPYVPPERVETYTGPRQDTTTPVLHPRQLEEMERGDEADIARRATDAPLRNKTIQLAENTERQLAAEADAASEERRLRQEQIDRDNARISAVAEERERRIAEAEKNTKPTTFWEDRGKPAELLSHFIVSLSNRSHMMAGGQGAGPVQQQIENAIAADAQAKRNIFEHSKYFIELRKNDLEEAIKAKARNEQDITDMSDLQRKGIIKQFGAYAAKIGLPYAGDEFDKIKAENDAKIADNAAKRWEQAKGEVRNIGAQGEVRKNIGGAPAGDGYKFTERTAATAGQAKADALARIAEIVRKNPNAMKEVGEAELSERQYAESGDISKAFAGAGKALGAVPLDVQQRLKNKSEDARELYSLLGTLETSIAREMDPVGALNQDVILEARKRSGVTSGKPKEFLKIVERHEAKARKEVESATPGATTSTQSRNDDLANALSKLKETKPGSPEHKRAQRLVDAIRGSR